MSQYQQRKSAILEDNKYQNMNSEIQQKTFKQIHDLEGQIIDLNEEQKNLKGEIEKKNNNIQALLRNFDSLSILAKNQKEENEKLEKQLKKLESQYQFDEQLKEQSQKKQNELVEIINTLNKKLQNHEEEQVNNSKLESLLEKKKDQIKDLQQQMDKLRNYCDNLIIQNQDQKAITKNYEEVKKQKKQMQQQILELEKKIQDSQQIIEKLDQRVCDQDQQIKNLKEDQKNKENTIIEYKGYKIDLIQLEQKNIRKIKEQNDQITHLTNELKEQKDKDYKKLIQQYENNKKELENLNNEMLSDIQILEERNKSQLLELSIEKNNYNTLFKNQKEKMLQINKKSKLIDLELKQSISDQKKILNYLKEIQDISNVKKEDITQEEIKSIDDPNLQKKIQEYQQQIEDKQCNIEKFTKMQDENQHQYQEITNSENQIDKNNIINFLQDKEKQLQELIKLQNEKNTLLVDQLQLFEKEKEIFDEKLQCQLCNKQLDRTITCAPCGHNYCYKCNEGYNKGCQICNNLNKESSITTSIFENETLNSFVNKNKNE
ncbi:hypothetical protein PPERSA_02572 [Pseudocohnilembus persalinus]|uniref:RING-type domain-containing protein n=1 Tax=Pseudocohnilembus persalinus TaxID=266149 RepID=A0A0V0R5D5_PSEPJ|nr:hypothetical protein PPERSA_02572 [Pseudocohnilembus persalinus]|eukprot:KRX09700.1 hypothetical protein PPERSA_02572 [Pseudocohnilembus persalinus]